MGPLPQVPCPQVNMWWTEWVGTDGQKLAGCKAVPGEKPGEEVGRRARKGADPKVAGHGFFWISSPAI